MVSKSNQVKYHKQNRNQKLNKMQELIHLYKINPINHLTIILNQQINKNNSHLNPRNLSCLEEQGQLEEKAMKNLLKEKAQLKNPKIPNKMVSKDLIQTI